MLLAGAGLGLGLGLAFFLFSHRHYTAEGSLVYDENRTGETTLTGLGTTPTGTIEDPLLLATQVRLLQSDALAGDVIRTLHLGQSPYFTGHKPFTGEPTPAQLSTVLNVWKHSVSAAISPKTEVIEVLARTDSAQLSAQIVNELMSAYITRSLQMRLDTNQKTTQYLTAQLEDVRTRTEQADKRLAAYQREHSLVTTEAGDSSASTQLDALGKAAAEAQSQRIQREAEYQAASRNDALVLSASEGDTTLSTLRKRESDLKNQYAHMSTEFGSNYPRMRDLEAQIREVDNAIQAEVARTTERLKGQYQVSQQESNALNREVNAAKSQLYASNEGAVQLQVLQRDAKTNRDLYQDLLTKLQEAGVTAGLRSSNISIVDPARAPDRASDPKLLKSAAIGLLAGLVLGFSCAFLRYSLRDVLRFVEEAEHLLGHPVLGSIPFSTDFASGPARPGSALANAMRSVRTAILLRGFQAPRTLLITSPDSGEGKTTMCLHLARVFAQRGTRVLLIDADMHRGTLHDQFHQPLSPGLSELLAGEEDPLAALHTAADVPNLFFLTAGAIPPSPADLLDSDRMLALLHRLGEQFGLVLLDAPPILDIPDALILSSRVEGTILVVRHERTRRGVLARTLTTLRSARAHLTGVLYNAVPEKRSPYTSPAPARSTATRGA